MQRAVGGTGWLSVLTGIAIVLVALLLIALLVVLLPAARSVRRASERAEALLDRMAGDLQPIMRHLTSIADNADYISTAVRSDVGKVSQTVRQADERLNEALVASERRVRELGALLRLVQDEVEHAVVSTTAIVRGMGAGAAAFRNETAEFLDSDVLLDSDDELEEPPDEAEAEEMEYGDDWARHGGARDEERPRIRRRPRR
ncbi:MAG TPA: hypothetical protein VIQ60_09580 [Gemmatimonadaceae bacterium]